MKTCTKCGERKSLEQFYGRSTAPDGRRADCIACVKGRDKRFYAANRERIIAERRAYREANRIALNQRKRLARFDLSQGDYDAIIESQLGLCANPGCVDEPTAIDHDHSCCPTDRGCRDCVRAVLCGPCNRALGHAKEDAKRLRGLADYIESFK